MKNAILESAGKKAELGTVPTFPEFVDYVVAETRDLASPRDWKGVMTWKSYYAKCLPCDVRYDGKYFTTKIYLTTKKYFTTKTEVYFTTKNYSQLKIFHNQQSKIFAGTT